MKCGHCLTDFHSNAVDYDLNGDKKFDWLIQTYECPACNEFNIYLRNGKIFRDRFNIFQYITINESRLIHPKVFSRIPLSDEVTEEYKKEYEEACKVLGDSPMASAALSRRSLQHILRDKGGFKGKNLADEIQQAIDSKTLPSYVTESIDAIRNIGNFAAHPSKSNNSGEVVAVEPGEAEWNLDVIEMLFDIYFVQPAIIQKKREELNKKLAEAGKPPMK